MEKDTWGALIAKGSDVWPGPGKPVWLDEREEVVMHDGYYDKWYGGPNLGCRFYGEDIGKPKDVIRLPADHPAYIVIAWNAAHPDQPPFFPWGGGETTPGDWDRGEVLCKSGRTWNGRTVWWNHQGEVGDVIGYRRATPASTPAPLDEAAQAAIALVREIAELKSMHMHMSANGLRVIAEARRIANLPSFPKAVDPDEVEVEGFMPMDATTRDIVRAALKRGRELERERNA